MKKLQRMRGWLTKEDVKLLEEASMRPVRSRTHHDKWRCASCSYIFFYSSLKCPVCMGEAHKL